MLKCFCPFAAIMERSVVIDVYFTTGGGEREKSGFRLILYVQSLTQKTTMHFDVTVCCVIVVAS